MDVSDEKVSDEECQDGFHLELYLRDVTDGMPSPWKLPVVVVSQSFQDLIKVAQPGAHTPNCSVTDCGGYIERKLSSMVSTLHVYVKDEQGESVYGVVIEGKESETTQHVREEEWKFVSRGVIVGRDIQSRCATILRRHSLELEVCERNVRCGFRQHSSMAKAEASHLINATIKSAKNLVVEPPATAVPQHVYVREKEWEVVLRDVIDGEDCQSECAIIVRSIPWRSMYAKGTCDVDSDSTQASPIRGGSSDCGFKKMTEFEEIKVSPNQTLWPMCCSLPTGFSWSLHFAQSANRARLNRQPYLRHGVEMADRGPPLALCKKKVKMHRQVITCVWTTLAL